MSHLAASSPFHFHVPPAATGLPPSPPLPPLRVGLLALGSEGHPLTLLGGIRVNDMPLIAQSALASMADWGDVHGFLGDAMVWLSGLHALAALWHHRVLRDGVLLSMLPPRR